MNPVDPISPLQPEQNKAIPPTRISDTASLNPPQDVSTLPSIPPLSQSDVSDVGSSKVTVATFGQSSNYRPSPSDFLRKIVLTGLPAILALTVGLLYLWVLPLQWSDSYVKTITPLYRQQSTQLAIAAASLDRPVFTSNSDSQANIEQDFTYIKGVLQTATANTNNLAAKDHLTVLPGTTWSENVSKTNSKYEAMKQYVSDSQTFLSDYSTLLAYTEKANQIAQTQVPNLLSNFKNISNSGGNKTQLLASIQATTSSLQTFMSQVKTLSPSPDLQQFNSDLLIDTNGLNNSLQNISSAIQGNGTVNILNSLGEFITSTNAFSGLLLSNPTVSINTNSIIHSQFVNLEGERPLR